MKTYSKLLALAAALTALASSAFANQLRLDYDPSVYSNGNGGAFKATFLDSGSANSSSYSSLAMNGSGILTFCLEENEYFNPGWTYNYSLTLGAQGGGLGGQDAPGYDSVSLATAWLYSEFARGNLASSASGFAYTKAGFGDVQNAVWYLEGEGGANNYLAVAAVSHGSKVTAANGAYGVEVLHLTYLDGRVSQDQLYYHVEPTHHTTPDQGMTVVLLGLSLLGIAGFRRKYLGK